MANRFVIVVFGDLKNYVYHYRWCTIEHDVSHIHQAKANLVGNLLSKDQIAEVTEGLSKVYLDQEADQIEVPMVKVGEFHCLLDPSPKLPSSLIVN